MKIVDGDEKPTKKMFSNFEIDKPLKRVPSNPLLRVLTTDRSDGDIMFSPVKPRRTAWPFQRRSSEPKNITRIIDRGGDFHQSNGGVSIRKRIRREDWRSLYLADWFHSVVDAPTGRTLLIISLLYIVMVNVFALCYYLISTSYPCCNLEITHYADAVGFSLQTMATIGYDTKDIFFGDCWLALTTLLLQILAGIFSDSLILGIIFCRLSRPHARASTILFSNKGIIIYLRLISYLLLLLLLF